MFAVIVQSQSPYGVRQTAVVPLMDKSIRVFNRVGGGRGVSGAWSETAPDSVALDEFIVGVPKAISITPSDYRDLQFPLTPTTLMQKLVRQVKDEQYVLAPNTLGEVYTDILTDAVSNPASLMKYTKAMTPVAVSPTIQVAPQPVVEPAPVDEPVMETLDELRDKLMGLSAISTQPLKEEVMEMTTLISPPATEVTTRAVLHTPDVEPYFEREWNGVTEAQVYAWAHKSQLNVLLTGDAGTGKTSSARNYAAKNNLPFVTIECTQQIDQSITQGRYVPTGVGNSMRWTYSQLATAIQQPSVILINELTRMNAKSASLFLRLLQERELLIEPLNEVIKVHPECIFIADQNTGLGYTGTVRQDNALLDRFNVKLEFKYDDKIESKFIKSPTLLLFANSIRQASEMSDQFSVPMSTRLLKNFIAQATNLNFEFAVTALLNAFPKSDGEREALKMRFDAEFDKIAQELNVSTGSYSVK